MEQEDYIKKQIDQFGRVLGKILADLIGLKNQGQLSEEGIEATNLTLKNELGLNITDLTLIPKEKFIKTLQESKKLSGENLDKIADLLFLIAEEQNGKEKDHQMNKKLYERALIIYEFIEKKGSTYSLDRQYKIEVIKARDESPN